MTGLPLLDWTPPFVRTSATSKAAAGAIKPKAGTLRALVLATLKGHPAGLTDEEIIELTGMSASTARPRRVELVEAGLVVDSGLRRQTKSGRQASIWVAR